MQNAHLFNLLPVEKPFKCTKSGLGFSTNTDKNIDPKHHTIDKYFKCSQCPYSTMSLNNLRKHKINNCSLEKRKTFRCHACDYVCHTKHMMNSHFFSTHTGSKVLFQCTYCDFKTILINSLENHVQKKHSTHLEYPCTSCDFLSNSQKSIQTHMAEQHPDQLNNYKGVDNNPDSESGIEKDSFDCNDYVNYNPHHTMKHKEDTAGDIYKNGVDLKVEEQLMPKDVEIIEEIEHCSNLPSPGYSQNIVSNSPEITTRNTLNCQHCDFSTVNKIIFKRHLKTHISEKTHKCSYCGKCFYYKGGLMKHQRTHTGEKPFQCRHCDICFAHKDSKEENQKTQTGKKSYQCNNCDKCFTQLVCSHCNKDFSKKINNINHLKTHNGKKPYQCSHFRNTHTCKKPYPGSQCNKTKHKILKSSDEKEITMCIEKESKQKNSKVESTQKIDEGIHANVTENKIYKSSNHEDKEGIRPNQSIKHIKNKGKLKNTIIESNGSRNDYAQSVVTKTKKFIFRDEHEVDIQVERSTIQTKKMNPRISILETNNESEDESPQIVVIRKKHSITKVIVEGQFFEKMKDGPKKINKVERSKKKSNEKQGEIEVIDLSD